jgi:acetylornithine deacetylase/succinyl-diaminopimelate desuccinylase-like protein
MFHGPNERIPVDGLAWGTQTLAELIDRFVF